MSRYTEFDEFTSMQAPSSNDGYSATERSLQEITENVQHFNNNVVTLERRYRLLHTPQDNVPLRQEIIELVGDTSQLAKITSSSIKKLKLQRGLPPHEKLQFDRLVNTFSSAVSKFQTLQQSAADLEHEMLDMAKTGKERGGTGGYGPYGSSLPEADREDSQLVAHDSVFQAQQLAFMEEDVVIVEQRERDMRQLETDILDINDIFRDMGTMVNEQGEMIDNIEANVEVAQVRVEDGNKQLTSAVRHKRCSRKLTAIIVCIVIGVVIAVAIAIVILLRIFAPSLFSSS